MPVIGFLELLLSSESIGDEDKTHLKPAKSSAISLLQLINDILDLSKIEQNRLEIEDTPFSLDEILDKIDSIGRMLLAKEGKKIEFRRSEPNRIPLYLHGDPYRLEQILLNLISNAVTFTEKGYIEYGVHLRDYSTLEFTVRDTGIGISEEKKEIIFQPFRQAEEKITRRYGGTGLGLSICIIAFTAGGSVTEKDLMFEAGCNGILTKPLERQTLLSTIDSFL